MTSLTPAAITSTNLGRAGFPVRLIDLGLVTAADLAVAEVHAARENIELADALVVLGFVAELDCYAALAAAADCPVTCLDGVPSSELAVQLVPERVARRH